MGSAARRAGRDRGRHRSRGGWRRWDRRSDRVSAAEEGGGRPMWRLPPAERRCKTAPTSTFRARRAGRSSLRATSSP